MAKKRLFPLIGLVVIVAAGAAFFFFGKANGKPNDMADADSTAVSDSTGDRDDDGKDKKKNPPVPVELATVAPRDLPSRFQTTGSLAANRQIQLLAKGQGQVTTLNVEEGDYVKKGQVLAELDPQEERILLDQAEVTLEKNRKEWERQQSLAKDGLTSESALEAAKELAERAVYERDLAKVQVEKKVVTAPFDGRVTLRHVELGQTVNMGSPVFDMADVSPMEVLLYLPEKIVRNLSVGQTVSVRPDVNPDDLLLGKVYQISPVVDPATSTVKVTLRIDTDPDQAARLGSFIRASITTDIHPDVMAIPKKAQVDEAGATYVYKAVADSVIKVPVQTGYADDYYVEVVDGLELGDTIVVVGQGGLRQGTKIKALEFHEPEEVAATGEGN